MAVTARTGKSAEFSFTSSETVDAPTGLADGDIIFLHIAIRTDRTISSVPSGFSLERSQTLGDLKLWTYTKIASSEPASYTVELSGGAFGVLLSEAFDVGGNATPITAQSENTASSTDTISGTAVSTSRDGGMVHAVFAIHSGSGFSLTDPAGWTQDIELTGIAIWESGYYKALASAGSSGSPTVENSVNFNSAIVFLFALDEPEGSAQVQFSVGGAAGLNADPFATALVEWSAGGAAGLNAEPQAGAVAAEVSWSVGGVAGLNVEPYSIARIEFSVGGAAGLNAEISQALRVQWRVGGAAGISVNLDTPALVSWSVGAAGGLITDVSTRAIIRITFGGAAGLRDNYTGPGSGIIARGDRDPLADLREGDEFLVYLPWGGVQGRVGLAQVLRRSARDDSNRQQFVVRLIEEYDPRTLPGLNEGKRPVYQPTLNEDVGQRISNTRRDLDRERRKRRRR